MSPERELEYAELSAFVSAWATDFFGIDPASEMHPSNALVRIAAAEGKSKALAGLRQAANDAVESSRTLTPAQASAFDARLRLAGIVTLSEMRRRHSRQYKSILKLGEIRSEMEYYLVKGVLASCVDALGPADQAALASMLLAFEQSN